MLMRWWMGVGSQHHDHVALSSENRIGTHCTGGRVSPKSVRTGTENFASNLFNKIQYLRF